MDQEKKILVIDDDESMTDILQLSLEERGYIVVTANTGENGLNAISKERPDLVILDIMLPGMNGLQVCERIKSNPMTRDIKVIMLTGRRKYEEFDQAIQLKADWYVNKPFTMDYLIRILGMVMKSDGEKNQY